MALRFQDRDDVDLETYKSRGKVWSSISGILCITVFIGISDFLFGASLKEYEETLAISIAVICVIWEASPLYWEFRSRTKEIDGKVSAIEEAVNASKETHAELLDRLAAIDEKLDAMRAVSGRREE